MRVLFICSANRDAIISPFIKSQGESLVQRGIELDYFTIPGKGVKGYLKSIPKLRAHLKKQTYDIIHAHYALCGWVAVLALPGIPVVVSYMGCDVYGDIDKEGRQQLYQNIILAKLLQPFVKVIIAKSSNLAKYVYLKKKVHIVPNGVNFDKFKPMAREKCRNKLGFPFRKKIILFLGNPEDHRKNIGIVREGIELTAIEGLLLCTPYPVPHKRVPLYLNACNVLVLTSFKEGSPNVVKEAMACNTPVIATDAGDAWQVISKTAGCFKIDRNPDALAIALKKALAFKGETTGREDIYHLNEEIIAEKIIQIYRRTKR